jgi:hypothetical protein
LWESHQAGRKVLQQMPCKSPGSFSTGTSCCYPFGTGLSAFDSTCAAGCLSCFTRYSWSRLQSMREPNQGW